MGWKLLGINAHPIFLGSKSQIQKGKMGKKKKRANCMKDI